MSIRVHELAKRCGISNKEMIEKLRTMNYPIKSHSSTVDKITAEAIEQEYGYVPPPPAPPKVEPVAPPPAPVAAPPPAPAVPPVVPAPAPVAVAPPPVPAPVARETKVVAPPAPVPVALPKPAPAPPKPVVAAPPRPVAPLPSKPAAKARPPAPARPVTPAPAPAVVEPDYFVDDKGHKVIRMKPPVVVRDIAHRIGTKPHLLLMELMEINVFANLNETIGEDVARKVCERHGFLFEMEKRERGAGIVHPPKKVETLEVGEISTDQQPRPPVVTVMGHVDHGKTSLLDAIRQTDVAAHETGGITQHIGASVVNLPGGKQITFLDTPGHEAFTKMRARGANLTDIVVLVVAADDGVMPQTIEALNHAKAAQVPVVVAVNKCDLPAANPDRVKKQLQEHGLNPESWGGDTIMVDVSATTKKGVDDLLEMILLQAEMMELKASPKGPARGNVIEAQLESGMGPTATVLVHKGLLRVGDPIICGPCEGKVRALIDDRGKRVKEAKPSFPVKIVGLTGVPEPGTEFVVMKHEKEARELGEQRQQELRASAAPASRGLKLEDLMSKLEEGEIKRLNLILKADFQGSLEAITESLAKIKSEKIELKIIHGGAGNITENDVLLASASDGVIIGFRIKPESGVSELAKREGVQIKLYSIIYELLEQIEEAMEGLLEPEAHEQILGRAEVRQVFQLSKGPPVAGCVVSEGRLTRSARARLVRRRAVHYEGRIASLRHFQDDVREVKTGMECGLRLENFSDFQVADVIECYQVEKVAAKL